MLKCPKCHGTRSYGGYCANEACQALMLEDIKSNKITYMRDKNNNLITGYTVHPDPSPFKDKIISSKGGTRQPLGRRYDLVFEEFGEALDAWAEIAHYGEQKHGNKNWWKLDFSTEQNPLNHAIGHLRKAMSAAPGEYRRRQLAKVLWNVAAQMWFDSNQNNNPTTDPTQGP